MNRNIYLRFVVGLVILISLFSFPWWITSILSLAALFYLHRYYEIIAFALIMDLAYSVPAERFSGFTLVCTVSAMVLLVVVEFLKSRMAFYR